MLAESASFLLETARSAQDLGAATPLIPVVGWWTISRMLVYI